MKSIGPYCAQMSSVGLRSDEGMSVVGWCGLPMLGVITVQLFLVQSHLGSGGLIRVELDPVGIMGA